MRSHCSARGKQCSAVLMCLARAGRLSTRRLSSEVLALRATPVKSDIRHMHGNALVVIWTLENVYARKKINQPRPKCGNAQRKTQHNAEAKRNDLQSYAAFCSLARRETLRCSVSASDIGCNISSGHRPRLRQESIASLLCKCADFLPGVTKKHTSLRTSYIILKYVLQCFF